jgi:hypothetical protein
MKFKHLSRKKDRASVPIAAALARAVTKSRPEMLDASNRPIERRPHGEGYN